MTPGGAATQILIKQSAADGDATWKPRDTPIAETTWWGNAEVAATSLIAGTGVFTKTGHGLSTGDVIFPITNLANALDLPLGVYPTGMLQQEYYVRNATANDFQIEPLGGGGVVTFTGVGDLSKWHFEKGSNAANKIGGMTFPAQHRLRYVLNARTSNGVRQVRVEYVPYVYAAKWFKDTDTAPTGGSYTIITTSGSVAFAIDGVYESNAGGARVAYEVQRVTADNSNASKFVAYGYRNSFITVDASLADYAPTTWGWYTNNTQTYFANGSTFKIYPG